MMNWQRKLFNMIQFSTKRSRNILVCSKDKDYQILA